MSVWIISLNLCSNWHWHKLHLILIWPSLFWAVISSTQFPKNYVCIYSSNCHFKASGILCPISAKANGQKFWSYSVPTYFLEKGDHYRSKTLLLYPQGKGSNMSPLLHSRVHLWPWITELQEIKFLLCLVCLHNGSKPIRITCFTWWASILKFTIAFHFSRSLLTIIIDCSFIIIT